ncbi:unnamed protein product [Sphagnum balticum]
MALRARIQARLVLARLYEVAGVVPKVHTWRGLSSAMAVVVSKEPSSSLGRSRSNLSPALSGFTQQLRPMTTYLAALPDIKDTRIWNTLNALLGGSWLNIDPEVAAAVESVLASKSEDNVGKEALATAWRSAKAVETFGGGLSELLMEVSDISGSTGEDVNPLPESTQKAVEAALGKYVQYLDSFDEESEAYLKKKVENDLGSLLVQIKQRFSSTDSKWSKITLLGTTGISGSYVERRSFVI